MFFYFLFYSSYILCCEIHSFRYNKRIKGDEEMLKRTFNYFTMVMVGTFFCVLGVSFLFDTLTIWNWLYITLVVGTFGVVIMKIFNSIMNYKKIHNWFSQFVDIVLWITVLIVSFTTPEYFYVILPRLVGGWISIHALVKIIVLYIRIHNRLLIQMHSVVYLIGDLIMCSYLLISPNEHQFIINCFTGGYFIIYGGNTLLDMIREILPEHSGEHLDQKIRLSVPPFLSMLIPPHLMTTLLDKDKEDQIKAEFNAIKEDIPVDLEVLIHLAPRGPAMFGHADLVYRGFVFSYGCYDPHERHLFGTLGDAVVIVAPRNSYIRNCIENENKILVSFGITLNKQQKNKLNDRLLEIFSSFTDFESDEQRIQKGLPIKGICDDYISRVTRTSPMALFYKIKEKRLKTFFVCSTNCVYFISTILNAIGLHLFDLSGIISPGAYYDFLNKQFKSSKGFIISRKLYRKKDMDLFL